MNLAGMFLATSAQSTTGGGGLAWGMIIFYVLIFIVMMYFLSIRPQKKQQQQLQELYATLEVGDCIVTTSGFYGVIIAMEEDTVVVEFGNNKNCRIPMKKSAIATAEKADGTSVTVDEAPKKEKKMKE